MAKTKFWTSEKLLSMTAILISLCTLGVFVYQTNLVRKQQYMSVFPYLSMGNYHTGSPNYMYVLENSGIGPALIKDVRVKYKGQTFYGDLPMYLRTKRPELDSLEFGYSNLAEGRLLPAEEQVNMIETMNNQAHADKLSEIINDDELEVIIEYESIYGERWRLSDATGIPIKIK